MRAGAGVVQDVDRGVKLIAACAAEGVPAGLNKLGVLLENGEIPGEPAEPAMAYRSYSASAAQGNALGLFCKGYALVNGVGVEPDEAEAFRAWEAAAALAPNDGSEEAAFWLWSYGKKSESYLKLAADLDFPPAVEALESLSVPGP